MHIGYTSSIFFLFAFLFVSPVLSPSINNNAIYLNWFVPLFDYYFMSYLFGKISVMKTKKDVFIGLFIFMSIIILHFNYMLLTKILSIVFSVVYLQYIYQRIGFKKLYIAFNINIFIAVLQFILYLIDHRLAYRIGPTYIARLVWKSFATATNTNFYPVFYLPRTCGLSREAGFFAALLCIIIIIYTIDENIKKTKFQKILFLIAYIVSFSKMSFTLLIVLAIFHYRRRLNKIPLVLIIALFIITLGLGVNYLNQRGFFIWGGESLTHRLWGYGVTFNKLSMKEFLIGNAHGVDELNQAAINAFPVFEVLAPNFVSFCGLPVLIIYTGYLGLVGYILFLKAYRVKSAYFLILLTATIDVDLFTATSFVVLAHWLTIFGMKEQVSNKY